MLPVKKDYIKAFEIEAKKYIDSHEELLNFVIKKYMINEIEFHNIFLKSNVILNAREGFLEKLLDSLKKIDMKNEKNIMLDISFLIYIMEYRRRYKDMCNNILNSRQKKIYAEDLFVYFEYLVRQIARKRKVFGQEYIEGISESQLGHIYDTFDEVINIIIESKIDFTKKIAHNMNENSTAVYEIVAHLKAVQTYFEEVIDMGYKPILTDKYWFLERMPGYWDHMEKYRDLNSAYQELWDNTTEEVEKIMMNVGALAIEGDNEIWRVDAAKAVEFDSALKINQMYKLLYPIYGSKDNTFIFKQNTYKISDILDLYEALYNYALKRLNDEKETPYRFISIYGRKGLSRCMNIKNSNSKDLFDLLTFDFDKDEKNIAQYKPLLKKGDIFYVLPSRIKEMTIERVIDKIFSSNEVNVNFKRGTGGNWKGIEFENSVQNFLQGKGIKFGKVEENKKRGIPEIDGIFEIDNYIFLYEAKAFIKPENYIEAYERLRDILFCKAKDQLDVRMDMLLHNLNVRKYIEEKIGFHFEGKIIVPFILVSNRFFAGYKEIINGFDQSHYPIVDFDDLKNILENRSIPIWNYNKENNKYKRSIRKIESGSDLCKFMYNQFENLQTCKEPIIVCGTERISYQIVEPNDIDW